VLFCASLACPQTPKQKRATFVGGMVLGDKQRSGGGRFAAAQQLLREHPKMRVEGCVGFRFFCVF
jgi:hypothetical protein